LRLDLRYQHHWSVLYDLKLILKTILIVIKGQGAC
jgi:lipopolysaccharide/colanic/teichoic acid biosynthesis glycosyltransferase